MRNQALIPQHTFGDLMNNNKDEAATAHARADQIHTKNPGLSHFWAHTIRETLDLDRD